MNDTKQQNNHTNSQLYANTGNKTHTESERFVNLYNILNDDVIGIIKNNLPEDVLVWLNKEYYIQYHSAIKKRIPENEYNEYINDIVKNDCSFVFEQILKENFDKFHKWKLYTYKNIRFHSYLTYLRYYARSNNSIKCLKVIDDYALFIKDFSPNWYKYRGIILNSNR